SSFLLSASSSLSVLDPSPLTCVPSPRSRHCPPLRPPSAPRCWPPAPPDSGLPVPREGFAAQGRVAPRQGQCRLDHEVGQANQLPRVRHHPHLPAPHRIGGKVEFQGPGAVALLAAAANAEGEGAHPPAMA